jgi:hypothetical protein
MDLERLYSASPALMALKKIRQVFWDEFHNGQSHKICITQVSKQESIIIVHRIPFTISISARYPSAWRAISNQTPSISNPNSLKKKHERVGNEQRYQNPQSQHPYNVRLAARPGYSHQSRISFYLSRYRVLVWRDARCFSSNAKIVNGWAECEKRVFKTQNQKKSVAKNKRTPCECHEMGFIHCSVFRRTQKGAVTGNTVQPKISLSFGGHAECLHAKNLDRLWSGESKGKSECHQIQRTANAMPLQEAKLECKDHEI